jgi:hypothetical protein
MGGNMKKTLARGIIGGIGILVTAASFAADAPCAIAEASKKLDPLEAGFCESDAVFVGVVESAIETESGVQVDGGTRTVHQKVRRSVVRVNERIKGKPADKVTMVAEIYSNDGYAFESGKVYLIFAKHLRGQEYAGANATCSVQPTLLMEDAMLALDRLQAHKRGSQKIDCKKLKAKA